MPTDNKGQGSSTSSPSRPNSSRPSTSGTTRPSTRPVTPQRTSSSVSNRPRVSAQPIVTKRQERVLRKEAQQRTERNWSLGIGLAVVVLIGFVVYQNIPKPAPAAPKPKACAVVALSDIKPTDTAPAITGDLKTQDGVQYIDLKVGCGDTVAAGASVTAFYAGWVKDGALFDASSKHGTDPATFTLDPSGLIAGWVQGIPGMKVGGIRRLIIPGALGYGAAGNSSAGIPANADLVFDVAISATQPATASSTP